MVGDRVLTTSGLRAVVVDTSDEDTIDLEIAPGVRTTWVRAAIRERIVDPNAAGDTGTEQAPEAAPRIEESRESERR